MDNFVVDICPARPDFFKEGSPFDDCDLKLSQVALDGVLVQYHFGRCVSQFSAPFTVFILLKPKKIDLWRDVWSI